MQQGNSYVENKCISLQKSVQSVIFFFIIIYFIVEIKWPNTNTGALCMCKLQKQKACFQ